MVKQILDKVNQISGVVEEIRDRLNNQDENYQNRKKGETSDITS